MITDVVVIALLVWAVSARWDRLSDHLPHFQRAAAPVNKELAAADIARRMQAQGITLEEIAHALAAQSSPERKAERSSASGDTAMKVFAYLGGIFVFAGIGVYISMFWGTMTPFLRVLLTLGTGIFLILLTVIAVREGKYPKFVPPLALIAAFVETSGWFVLIHELFPHGNEPRKAECIVLGIMLLQQACLFHAFRLTSLAFTALVATYCFGACVLDLAGVREEYISLLLGGSLLYTATVLARSPHHALSRLAIIVGAVWFNDGLYRFAGQRIDWHDAAIVAGLSLCSLAYGLRRDGFGSLAGPSYFFGSALFYDGLFEKLQHTPLEPLYLAACAGMLYGCTLLESRALLFTSVLAMLGFIGYYTSEHFLNSLGWPLALVIMGLAFFAVSALAMRVKRKYL